MQPRGEIERTRGSLRRAAERQCPQALVDDRPVVDVAKHALEVARHRIKCVYLPIAEVANQDVVREYTKRRGRARHAPWRIEMAVRGETLHKIAVGVEDVDDAVPRLVHRIMLRLVLQRVGHEQCVADRLYAERRVTLRQLWISKRSGEHNLREGAVEDVDVAGAEVGRIQMRIAM